MKTYSSLTILKCLTIVMLVLCTLWLNGQEQIKTQLQVGKVWGCSTASSQSTRGSAITQRTIIDTSPKVVNTFIHVVRRDNGTGGLTQTQINDWISLLCTDYMNINIVVNVIGQANLNNTSYFDSITDSNYSALVNTNIHNNAVDIYLLSPNDTYARAVDIPGRAAAVGGDYVGTSVLSHEFGHCLGLFHTHSGRGCDDYINCAEEVDGSNCSTCGDLVCDTPADPCLRGVVSSSCDLLIIGFNPDVDNIMSYSPPNCLSRLTNGQMERMHSTLISSSVFTNRSYNLDITGVSLVCVNGASFTIENLPGVDSIIWEHGSYLTISSGQNTSECTFSAIGNGSSWVRARLVNGCGSINLPRKNVWAGLEASFSGPTSILAGGMGTYPR